MLTNGRVLLADDQEHMRSLLRQCFENAGYEVDAVDDPKLAVDRLSSSKPDLVILDLIREERDGDAILRRLHAQGKVPPVVVLTAEATEDDDRPAPEGAAAVLRMPFTFPVLLGVCEALVAPAATP
jgi:CheY-like chemotaxis protein